MAPEVTPITGATYKFSAKAILASGDLLTCALIRKRVCCVFASIGYVFFSFPSHHHKHTPKASYVYIIPDW